MKRIVFGRLIVPVILVLGTLAGCATAPKEPDVSAEQAEMNQAIEAARAAVAKAKALDWIWRDTEATLEKAEAEAASAEPDYALATSLANKARSEAEMAVNQYYLEKAKVLYAEASQVSGLDASQQNTLSDAARAIQNGEGRKAYDLLTPLLAEIRAASIKYQVVRGDSLWSISGKPEIYNNPYQWPLIFKANRDQIKDADLIYPNQVFSVDRNPSAAEVEMAVDHARNRGAWSIGVVEESDRRYLGSSLELR